MNALKNWTIGTAILALMTASSATTTFAGDCGAKTDNTTAQATMASAKTETKAMPKTIVETAVNAGQFQTLVAAVKAAGLVETLSGEGPFTVFAPTDEAFAALPEGTVEALLKDKAELTSILTYHVVPGKVIAADVVKLDSASTVAGKTLAIEANAKGVMINDANVVTADIICSNGVIHVIDEVLLPN